MLFIHHHQAQIIIGDRFLEDGVGANQDIDPARCQISQQRLARLALVAATAQVLRSGLAVLGVDAPRKM